MPVSVERTGDQIVARTPFLNSNFNAKARNLAGHWDRARGGWIFDARNEPMVRAALRRAYGSDGTAPADTVSVRFHVDRDVWQGPVEVAGRTIARATGRDSGATLGQGIVMLSGDVNSGGSVKNWHTVVDATVLMHDVPRKVAEKMIAGGYTGVSEAALFDPEAELEEDED